MNRFTILFLLMINTSAVAEEIKIKASVGDHSSTYTVTLAKGEFFLNFETYGGNPKKIRIGKKNYDFVLRTSQDVIRLANKVNQKGAEIICQRDLSSVTILGSKGKVTAAQVCLLAKQPASTELRSLLNVLQMGI